MKRHKRYTRRRAEHITSGDVVDLSGQLYEVHSASVHRNTEEVTLFIQSAQKSGALALRVGQKLRVKLNLEAT